MGSHSTLVDPRVGEVCPRASRSPPPRADHCYPRPPSGARRQTGGEGLVGGDLDAPAGEAQVAEAPGALVDVQDAGRDGEVGPVAAPVIEADGGKLVELKGDVSDSVIIRELQWDAFGSEVLHVDFMRVDADERLTVEVSVELRGEAPGTREGGVVQHVLHVVKIEAPVASIPDRMHVNINSLQLDQVLTVADIEDMPSDAKLLTEADRAIVQCVVPAAETEEEAEGETAEPEVIGRKDDEGEEADKNS